MLENLEESWSSDFLNICKLEGCNEDAFKLELPKLEGCGCSSVLEGDNGEGLKQNCCALSLKCWPEGLKRDGD